MGKNLIMIGADWSNSGMQAPHTPLQWVSSNAVGQYFDTGIVRTEDMKLEVTFSLREEHLLGSDATYIFAGTIDNSSADGRILLQYRHTTSLSEVQGKIGQSMTSQRGGVISDLNPHTVSIDKTSIITDGVVKSITGYVPLSATSTLNIGIMSYPANTKNDGIKIHDVKIYSDYTNAESLIHHYIPVITQSGIVCFYDKISKDYIYTNTGTNPLYQ